MGEKYLQRVSSISLITTEDLYVIIRSRKLRLDKQYNDKEKMNINTNSDLQNTTQKTKDWATRG